MNKDTKQYATVNIHGKEYYPVSSRLEMLHNEKNDSVQILTEVLSHSPIVIRATLTTPYGTFNGISSVALDSSKSIERSNPYEVAETSAVGRALAFAGYGAVEGIASADEVARAIAPGTRKTYDVPQSNEELNALFEQEEGKTQNDKPMKKDYCALHDKQMVEAISVKTNKPYFSHFNDDRTAHCFGKGYK